MQLILTFNPGSLVRMVYLSLKDELLLTYSFTNLCYDIVFLWTLQLFM